VRRFTPRLPAPDVVRLLALLGEAGGQIRASGNTQLAVELLLLRWALMSRTVELEEVIRALGTGGGQAVGRSGGQGGPVEARSPDTPPAPSADPPDRRSAGPPEVGAFTLERLRGLWPQIVADARAKSQLLGTLVAVTEVVRVEGTSLTIRLLDANSVHAEGLERQRESLAHIVGRYLTEPIRIVFDTSTLAAPSRQPRLTEESARAERLSRLRAGDARLDAAAEALDLELLE
jgi:hypothetical protein